MNRTLQELRRSGLITLSDRELVIADLPALEALALFTPGYLHLDKPAEAASRTAPEMSQAPAV